jgi:hypothetical protein
MATVNAAIVSVGVALATVVGTPLRLAEALSPARKALSAAVKSSSRGVSYSPITRGGRVFEIARAADLFRVTRAPSLT